MKLVKPVPPNPPLFMPLMDTSAITRKWINIEYTPDNPHPARRLDIYLPETGDGPFPTIICIHGGAFIGGQKEDFQCAGFIDGVAHGFAVVSVEQRLCSGILNEDGTPTGKWLEEGRFPFPLHDYKAAIRFLRANANKWHLDPTRFATAGTSAGGWHAIMAAATANQPAMYDETLGFAGVDDSVHACVDWFGCGDLLFESQFNAAAGVTITLPNGIEIPEVVFEDVYLGVKCVDYPGLARFSSPEAWVSDKMPPVLLQHGAADDIVPVECSRRLEKVITKVCGAERVTYDEFPDWAHGDDRFYSDENLERVYKWLHEKLATAYFL